MLDLSHLFGFAFHAHGTLFNEIKQKLVQITSQFEDTDAAVVMGEYRRGPSQISAEIMNHISFSDNIEFLDMAVSVANVISESDINSPKFVFIISDVFNGRTSFEISKMKIFNESCSYPSSLHFIQIHPSAKSGDEQRTIVRDAKQLKAEITKIIKEANVS